MEKYGQLFESVFKEKLTDAAVVSHLEKIAAEHPYFSIAQFYLLLQCPKNTPAYRAQAKKTAALFNNNYWLNFQLLEAGESHLHSSTPRKDLTTAPVEPAATDGFIESKPFEEVQEESRSQTEAETELEDSAGALTAAETEAAPIGESTSEDPAGMLSNEPPDLSIHIPEPMGADENTLTAAPQEAPENVPPQAAVNTDEIQDEHLPVDPKPSITDETAPALMQDPISTEPAASVEVISETEAQEITIDKVPENEAVTDQKETPDSHVPMEQAPPTIAETAPELMEESTTAEAIETIEAGAEDAAVEIHNDITAENPIETTAVMVQPGGDKPGDAINKATPAEPTESIDAPFTDETDLTTAAVPPTTPPDKTAGELLFEPLHTSDYFASVGIKLSEEEKTADKLGKQLKSFTDWLKTMKKIPAGQASRASQPLETAPTVADNSIQQLAEQSNQGNEVLTEAMAAVLLQQGRQDKAIEILQKLSLLDPGKSAYFAAKINQIKEN